jgi:hypothetical protein
VNWQGTWSSATTYAINDAVFYNGSSYRSLVASNLNFQSDVSSSQWTLFASAGGSGSGVATFGQTTSGATTGATGYTFQASGASTSATARTIGVLGRAAGGLSGAISVGSDVPSSIGLTANFTMGVMGNANANNVGVLVLSGAATSAGMWGHNSSTGSGNWNVGVIGTTNGTNNAATGVYGQGNRGVSGASGLVANGSNSTQANRLQAGGVFGSTSNTNGNAGFFLGRVVIENTAAAGAATSATDPFIVWCQNNGAAGINNNAQMFANSFNPTSDRNKKENLQAVDTEDVLLKLVKLPVTTWNFIGTDPSIRSMGPMAQDFHAAFGLSGTEDKRINLTDANGVALAAIQGLNAKLERELAERDVRIEQQQKQLEELISKVESMSRQSVQLTNGLAVVNDSGMSPAAKAGLGIVAGLPLVLLIASKRRRA